MVLPGPKAYSCVFPFNMDIHTSYPPAKSDYVNSTNRFCSEARRLETYSDWPVVPYVYPTQLARSGFYHNRNEENVVCYSCCGTLEVKELKSPHKAHEKKYPTCLHILGRDKRNIPITLDPHSLFNTSVGKIVESVSREKLQHGPVAISRNTDLDAHGNLLRKNQTGGLAYFQKSASTQKDSDPNATSSTTKDTLEALSHMRYEIDRRESFQTWPPACPVTKNEAAQAGFYFIGPDDTVKCAFCGGVLCNWAYGDAAYGEHKQYFPKCPFIIDPKGCGNVPYEVSVRELLRPAAEGMSLQNTQAEYLMQNAAYPKMATGQARLRSYTNWPAYLKQTPAECADAGFIYTGLKDNIKCFSCGGGLRNWDPQDDPWVEHARWFPRCKYIITVKGQQFVDAVSDQYPGQRNMPELEPEYKASYKEGTHSLQAGFIVIRKLNDNQIQQVKARMNTPAVRTVLELGFSQRLVAEVLANRIKDSVDDYPNAQSLLEAVLELEVQCPELQTDSQPLLDEAVLKTDVMVPPPVQEPPKLTPAATEAKKLEPPKLTPAATEAKKLEPPKLTPAVAEAKVSKDKIQTKQENIQSIIKEHRKLKEDMICKICMDVPCNIVFLPCGHLCVCVICGPALRICPICRVTIKGTVKIYMS